MQTETRQSWAVFKSGERQLVSGNYAKADKRNRQGVPMKQRDAEQHQRKQDKFERNPEDEDWLGQFHPRAVFDLSEFSLVSLHQIDGGVRRQIAAFALDEWKLRPARYGNVRFGSLADIVISPQ